MYGETFMKRSNNAFSVFKAKTDEWWLYLRSLEEETVRYLGKLSKGCIIPVAECSDFYARHYSQEFYEKVMYHYESLSDQRKYELEFVRTMEYNSDMKSNVEKKERNKLIYKLIETDGWTHERVRRRFRFKSRGTVFGIYKREKLRAENCKQLSTAKVA